MVDRNITVRPVIVLMDNFTVAFAEKFLLVDADHSHQETKVHDPLTPGQYGIRDPTLVPY